MCPHHLVGLYQNVLRSVQMKSLVSGALHTIIRNNGLIWIPAPWNRWMCPSEIMTSMGFPISDEAVKAASGVTCQFSRATSTSIAHPLRTRRSVTNQAGNAMHVNAIGCVIACATILEPNLGTRAQSSSAAQQSFGKMLHAMRDKQLNKRLRVQ